MNLFKFAGLALTLVALSGNSAFAGMSKYKAQSGKVLDYVGCGLQDQIVRKMMKHPELYGKPPASLAANVTPRSAPKYWNKHPELWNKPQPSMAALKSP